MDNIKYIAENLGKTGMPVEKIADVLEMDLDIVGLWLDDAGIDPKNSINGNWMASLRQKQKA